MSINAKEYWILIMIVSLVMLSLVACLPSKINPPYKSAYTPSQTLSKTNVASSQILPTEMSRPTLIHTDISEQLFPDLLSNIGWDLAFSIEGSEGNGIYIFSSKNGEIYNITERFDTNVSFSRPSWSPDGKQVAYHWGTAGVDDVHIRIANTDGSDDQELTIGRGPAWAPDGKVILFVRNDDIYLIELASKKVFPLLITKDIVEGSPAWSPDGKQIAYVEYFNFNNGKLYIMNSDGTDKRFIDTGTTLIGRGRISWSPDGTKIVFGSNDRCSDIYVVDLYSNKIENLTNSLGHEGNPSWSPDGKWIAFIGEQPDVSCFDKNGQRLGNILHAYVIENDGSNRQMIIDSHQQDYVFSLEWSPVLPLEIGKHFVVSPLGDRLRIHEESSLEDKVVLQLNAGDNIIVLEGPKIESDIRWWKIEEVNNGVIGWIVEEPGWFKIAP